MCKYLVFIFLYQVLLKSLLLHLSFHPPFSHPPCIHLPSINSSTHHLSIHHPSTSSLCMNASIYLASIPPSNYLTITHSPIYPPRHPSSVVLAHRPWQCLGASLFFFTMVLIYVSARGHTPDPGMTKSYSQVFFSAFTFILLQIHFLVLSREKPDWIFFFLL